MQTKSLYFLAVFALAASLLAACTRGSSEAITGSWQLASYGSPSDLAPAVPDVDTTITFGEDGSVSGNVGCNDFGGDYTVDGDNITFDNITSTLMLCAEPAVGEQETVVLNTLSGTTTFTVDSQALSIISEDGSSAISLVRK